MNIFDLFETPGMGHPRDTKGIQSAADQSAASVIGSGTTKREDKKKPVTMMGMNVKESSAHDNFKKSVKDRGYDMDAGAKRLEDLLAKQKREREERERAEQGNEVKEAHPNQQMSIYNPDGPTYRQQKMPGYDIDDIYSRGQAVDLDPEVGDINAPEDHLDAAEKANLKKILKQYTDRLNPLQQNVIFLRYWDDHTLESAGKILGVTPERVRQIEARALRYIRQYDKENSKDLLGLSKRKTYEGILDRAAPKLPKPRNPADQVLQTKVNAGGRHLDKKRRQELNPKHKHKDLMAESLRPGERHHFETDPETGKRVYKGIRGDQYDAPKRGTDDPAARADQERKAHIQHDRGMTEQEVSIGDRKWPLPKGDHDDEMPGDTNDDEMGIDETIRKINNQYRLYSKKGKNLGTFDSKAGAEKHEREVQYFKHMKEGADSKFVVTCYNSATDDKETVLVSADDEYDAKDKVNYALGRGSQIVDVRPARGDEPTDREYKTYKHPASGQSRTGIFDRDQDVEEGWKGKLAGAALAGAAALGGGAADAQQIDLPGPQVSYVAHVHAEANGREVDRTVNLGSRYDSEEEAYADIENSLQAKGITRYSIRIEQKYDMPSYSSNQPRGGTATGRNYGTPGIGDMVINHIGREIRGSIPSKGGYATGGTNRGERPRDGSQWWRDQLPPLMREEALEEDIERHLMQMRHAGYDIVQEEWSDKYKDSINCSNPKGFSQKAHCAGRKKNEDVSEEKVRLDPKCWKGKKIGNPKTKMKGGVRVNNCVPK